MLIELRVDKQAGQPGRANEPVNHRKRKTETRD